MTPEALPHRDQAVQFGPLEPVNPIWTPRAKASSHQRAVGGWTCHTQPQSQWKACSSTQTRPRQGGSGSQAAETSAISRHGTIKKKTSSMSAPSSIGTSLRRNWPALLFRCGRRGLSAGEKSSSRKNRSIYSLLMRTTWETDLWFEAFGLDCFFFLKWISNLE